MQQYQQNPVMMQPNNYMQQPQQSQPQQQTPHSQMYVQGQMNPGPYMNSQMIGNPAK